MHLFMVVAEEAERIAQSKGQIFCLEDEPGVYRVWMPNGKSPGLALSRAFGDDRMKDFGLIATPDVTQRNITSKDQFVILASDGVLFSSLRATFRHFIQIINSNSIKTCVMVRYGMLFPMKRQCRLFHQHQTGQKLLKD